MTQGIYRIRNTCTGSCYIGSSAQIEIRLASHKRALKRNANQSLKLQRAWNKYGECYFVFEMLEAVEDLNLLLAREQFWIWRESAHTAGYNILECPGRPTGYRHSPESRARISAALTGRSSPLKGRRLSETHNANAIAARHGGKRSPDTRRRMSEVRKVGLANGSIRLGRTVWTRSMRTSMRAKSLGRVLSADTRAKMAAAKLGKPWTPAQREALADLNKGHVKTAAHRSKLAASTKAFWADPENKARQAAALKAWWARRRAGPGAPA